MESQTSVAGLTEQYETHVEALPDVGISPLPQAPASEQGQERPATADQIVEASYAQLFPSSQARRRYRPSARMWRLLLFSGDSMLLLPFLVWLTKVGLAGTEISSHLGTRGMHILQVVLVFAVWTFTINALRGQEPERAVSRLKSVLCVLGALALTVVFLLLLFYLQTGLQILAYAEKLAGLLILVAFLLCGWRILMAEMINLPAFRRQAVIVGISAASKELVAEYLKARRRSIDILGFIGESARSAEQESSLVLPLLGGAEALERLIRQGLVDVMIMAIDRKENTELFRVALEGARQNISLLPVATVYENISEKIPVEYIGDHWSMALPEQPYASPLYLCWQRALDLTFGLCGLLIMGLVLPILAPLIYLDSPGPIFFSQERAGYRGRRFHILKFRSMRVVKSKAEDALWASKGDTRITRVGHFLRATHLDELPQMLNIVRGDMSLIGPRPERPDYVAELARQSDFYTYRLSVRPGLTGWAQVKYGYGTSEQDELVKLQYDLFYIKHRSYLLDIVILLRTILEVVLLHGV